MSTALERNALRMAREHKEKQTSLKPGFYVVDGRLSFDPFRGAPADAPRYDPRFGRGCMTEDDWAEVYKRLARRAAEELSNGMAKQLAEHHKAAQQAFANGVAVTRVMLGDFASQNQKCGSDRAAEALTQYYQDRAKKPHFVEPFTAAHGKKWSKDGVWSATDSQGNTTVFSTGGSITIDAGAQHGKV